MKRVKKPKKKEINRPTKTPFEIVKTANYVLIAVVVRTLWTVYGWRHKRIADFLEAILSLMDEATRFGYDRLISETKEMTGIDVVELVDSLYTKEKKV